MRQRWVAPRLVVRGGAPSRPVLSAQAEPLAESDSARAVVHGWFQPPHGEVTVEGLATFRFSCGDDVVYARPVRGAEHGDLTHSFYGTAIPLFAWACWEVEVIHASAASGARGVVAFCGPSGAGKSTLAYAMASRGHARFAEDAVAFRPGADGVRAVALPFTTNLRTASAEHFARRRVVLPSPTDVHRFADEENTLAAVVVLDKVEEPSSAPRLTRLPASEALLTLLPNAYRFQSQPAERARTMLDAYLSLVAHVPVLRLTYGQDFEQLESVLDRVEAATAL